ncbi:hypothetical protein NEPAR06_1968 [Nematocida parisii]|uniref:Uncharacterized protein n=1 Tax=Nematocida parisii (strain ERTm3) TaxID=935791 RepID=I3EFE3_NEMP3|nr:uncharacterized protein NEPG_02115 [Nematocida parisii ERTm1]EIJ87940.1 hypothetical protein NEQG_02012 [Nematocida parisii ERTm3]EIJ93159.1 hypothetical protein NEPG_02115 [Nematocida parisii ERTm1]KAI5155586.1 hypothetical protein NEPAR06_1968 [Nematocida parisii]|eukprot:XP_013059942.1 hypothetical protein NEPG_02115 [Nematocida parisii ERTm1]
MMKEESTPMQLDGGIFNGNEDIPIEIQEEKNGIHIAITGKITKGVGVQYAPGNACVIKHMGPSIFDSLEIVAYDKKSIPMIRHILTSALDNEVHKLGIHLKFSMHLSVLSSQRYMEGAVHAVNMILDYINIPSRYEIEAAAGNAEEGRQAFKQTIIKNNSNEIIHSVWVGSFSA